jgi:hypothetical protein
MDPVGHGLDQNRNGCLGDNIGKELAFFIKFNVHWKLSLKKIRHIQELV